MKKLIYLGACLLIGQFGRAQQMNGCGADEMQSKIDNENPQAVSSRAQFEAAFKEYLKTADLRQFKPEASMGKASQTIIIPVVFHILHNYNQNSGVGHNDNYTDDDIRTEITNMNNNYRATNPYMSRIRDIFKDVVADMNIEFRLAKIDPNGKPTNGIERFFIGKMAMKGNDYQKLNTWDPQRYMNVWTIASLVSNSFAIGGYAYFPNAAPSKVDGPIVSNEIGITSSPIPFSLNTVSHEAGHYLGLSHPFEGSQTDSCGVANDGCDDTPPVYYIPTTAANAQHNKCSDPSWNSCSTDKPDLPDQMENIMDYYGGSCASIMFTLQQSARAHFSLDFYRKNLWTPENLLATGTAVKDTDYNALPIPSFNIYNNQSFPVVRSCVGNSVTFREDAYNATVSEITKWEWDFGDGATPATFTGRTPSGVVYNTPGSKTISLTVTTPKGTNTLKRENYLLVEEMMNRGDAKAFYADWDYNNDFLAKGWYFSNEQPNAKWVRVTDVQYGGVASMKLDAKTTSSGFDNALISPSYDLSASPKAYIQFKYAFAPNMITDVDAPPATSDSRDKLTVLVSTDCGVTWIVKGTPVGGSVTTTGVNKLSTIAADANGEDKIKSGVQSSIDFKPTSLSQWKNVLVEPTGISGNNVKFKILFSCGGGNNFYIDELMLGVNTGVNDVTKSQLHFSARPNPFNTETIISYDMPEKATTTVKLFDITGREVAEVFNGTQDKGTQQVRIDRNELGLSSGLYFVKLELGGVSFSHKVLVD